eukprot:SM000131S26715  [mRNA]  locus=s131:120573:124317:- [translate_table: standard]
MELLRGFPALEPTGFADFRKCPARGVARRSSQASPVAVAAPAVREVTQHPKLKLGETLKVGVLGASGYTGAEIVRLLATHPFFNVSLMTADRKAGQSLSSVFPHITNQDLPDLVAVKDADFDSVDAVFCCLPHGTTQEIIAALPKKLKVVDLSAISGRPHAAHSRTLTYMILPSQDFRLKDIQEYAEWYGHDHRAADLQKEAVYGLTEVYRDDIRDARLVANPGCYPTSIQLPLIPLIKGGLIDTEQIIADAKSGVSGAGRSAKEANLYTEIAEGINAYGVGSHRHMPEIEQGLSEAAGSRVMISFTPHLMPMSRGMQSTIYVQMKQGVTVDDLHSHLTSAYHDEEFVHVLPKGSIPHTRNVRGSNYVIMNVFADRLPGRAIVICAHPSGLAKGADHMLGMLLQIDNLVKGASGQALQNLNLMMGAPEDCGLLQQPMFP